MGGLAMKRHLGRSATLVAVWLCAVAALNAGSAESANFRVIAPTDQIAQQVCQQAERWRRQKALEWLGKEMPPWGQKCPVEVKVTPGGRGTSGGGATTFEFDNGAILSQH